MTPAAWSLLALLAAIVLSFSSRVNVGLVALPLAWLVGVYVAHFKVEAVAAGFPASLFLTLAGVTLLFALTEVNGTLAAMAQRAVRLCHGNARLLPLLLFGVAFVLSSLGPGAVPSVALVAPFAMAVGARAGVPAFLTALMVGNGANAGNLSPLSAVGVIANEAMARAGVGGHEWKVLGANLAAHLVVGGAAYVVLGARLAAQPQAGAAATARPPALGWQHSLTLAVLSLWVVGVVWFELHVGLSALAAAALLVLARAGAESAALKAMPWSAIVMVTGVTTLIAVLEKTQGLDLFTTLLSRLASPDSVNGMIALVTGVISTYSSTSGVVLPAFLPTAPGLVAKLGGGDPLAVCLSINVGSSLVDVSPLSTLGALCVAAVSDPEAARDLFRKLLLWGFAMTLVGAAFCQLLAGPLARL